MAINFTDSPANGATQVVGGRTYTYNSAKNKWDTTATEVTGPTATVYATVDALPTSGNITGAQAYVSGNNRLYIWNGTGWYNIALINTAPTISGVNAAYELATDGSSTSVVITATDPEGLPLTYSIVSDTSGDIATVTQGVGGNTDIFTITPTTNTENGGTFSLTFRASDGVNIATAVSEFTLQFFLPNSNYTTALITTNGSAGQNATFTDSSSNSHTVTAYGNTTQNSFSPYRSGGYSTYFDGSGDYLSIVDNSMTSSGEFTVEGWAYVTSNTTQVIFHWSDISDNLDNDLIFEVNGMVTCRVGSGGNTKTSTATGVWSLNTWHHFAVVRNSSNNVDVYLDGTHIIDHGVRTDDMDNTLEIGRNPYSGGGSYVTGYITDFRIVESAVYTSAFTPPTERLSAVANTKLLTCHLPYLADGSTNGYTITPNGNVSTKPFGPYDYQEYAVGDHGGSVYLDGSGDYLTVANDASLKPTGDFTAEGWCYVDGTNASGSIFNMWTGSQGRMWALYVSSTGISLNGNSVGLISHSVNNLNKWVHVAFTRDNSNALCTLYVNGKSVGTSTTTFSGSSAPLAIGFNLDGAPASYYYNGSITDLRISDTVRYTSDFTPPTEPFTTDSNTALLLSGQGAVIRDKSQSIKNLTLAGNTTASTAQYKYLPSSIYLDGSGDYIRCDDAFSSHTSVTQPYTIEMWSRIASGAPNATFETLIGINRLSDGNNQLLFGYTTNNYTFHYSGNAVVDTGVNHTVDSWEHIAIVGNDGTNAMAIYINGTQEYTTSTLLDVPFSECSILFGAEADAANAGNLDNYYQGHMSDIRLTTGLARYTANFTPPSAALDA